MDTTMPEKRRVLKEVKSADSATTNPTENKNNKNKDVGLRMTMPQAAGKNIAGIFTKSFNF